jgi:glycosyltransferase involved in cell wall biosynthesis
VIRVLHIVTTLDIGGAEAQIRDVVTRLDRSRFEPAVAWLKGAGEMAPEFEAAGIPAVDLSMESMLYRPGPAIQLMRRLRPHLVHTHLGKADVVGAVTARSTGVPVLVSTKHNEDAYLRYPPVGAVAHGIARMADRVVVISDAVGRFLRRKLRLPESHLRRIRYGYPANGRRAGTDPLASVELKRELGLEPRATLVTCVARLTKQKGLFDLLRAMSRLREAAPDARLLIVGRGELNAKLRGVVSLLGLESVVRFLGFRRDIRRLLSASDLLVLPSHWEGFGLVLLEAMAVGIPVVGTRVGAIPEVVADGETGLLVPPRDPDALATGLVRLLRHPDTAAEMGLAGRRRLAVEFGMKKAVAAHEDLYAELLGR